MRQMVRDQQAELTEGYRYAAASKLAMALRMRAALLLAASLSRWRACALWAVDDPLTEAARAMAFEALQNGAMEAARAAVAERIGPTAASCQAQREARLTGRRTGTA